MDVFKYLFLKLSKPKSVLFYRDFKVYTGGHQKVADYFNHLMSNKSFDPYISFSLNTYWDNSNPWFPDYQSRQVAFEPIHYDYAFLAGMDWRVYLAATRPANQPIINFIQHVRHADPAQDLFEFLSERAIRICVSQQVADAIQNTGRVNGPVFTIPNGVDLPDLSVEKSYDVIILGIKQPGLAATIYEKFVLDGYKVLLVNEPVLRVEWFTYLAASRIAVVLPHYTEGFYLPALEAMKYCDLVVVPDCIGNRGFCNNNQNCLMPEYKVDALISAVGQALSLLHNEHVLTVFKQEMRETLRTHSLINERKAFVDLMTNVEVLWAG